MKKRSYKGIIFVLAGVVLILSALSLFLYNKKENLQAKESSDAFLHEIEEMIKEKQLHRPTEQEPAAGGEVQIGDYLFLGYLSLPSLSLELPVIADWDYNKLQVAPCRQFGTAVLDNLVIAAHNYDWHFGRLKYMEIGDSVTFTDMEGTAISYTVQHIETVNPSQPEKIKDSGYDLVLYTCTESGAVRVTVFCNRTEAEQEEQTNSQDA